METTLQIRIDRKTKNAVAKIFKSLGLDLSSGVKLFLNHVIRYKGITFPLIAMDECTLEQRKNFLEKTREIEDIIDHKK